MERTFVEDVRRHWMTSIGLWCCLMIGVVSVAHSKQPRAKVQIAASSITMPSPTNAPRVDGASVDSRVTLTFKTLDLSTLNAAAYGDGEL